MLATQNPIEMEGTYPLPEAQLDRFLFKLLVPCAFARRELSVIAATRTTGAETPSVQPVLTAAEVLEMQQLARDVPIAAHVKAFALKVMLATHQRTEFAPESGSGMSGTAPARAGRSRHPRGQDPRPAAGPVQRRHEDVQAVACPRCGIG